MKFAPTIIYCKLVLSLTDEISNNDNIKDIKIVAMMGNNNNNVKEA